jgi:amino acid adenylation domain-containing protein
MALFFNKVSECYTELKNGLIENVNVSLHPYSDHINDELSYLNSQEYSLDKEYWVKKLGEITGNNAFESCFKANRSQSLNSTRKEIKISRKTFNEIDAFCSQNKCTIFHYFISAIIILNRVYNNDDIIIGLPMFNRRNKKFKNTLGAFVNILLLSTSVKKEDTFLEILNQVKTELKSAYRHQRISIIDILDELDIKENIYNVSFSYQKNTYNNKLGDANADITYLTNGDQEIDLTIHLLEYNDVDDLVLAWDYRDGVFEEEVIDTLIKDYDELINNVLFNSKTSIRELECLDEEVENLLLNTFNNNKLSCLKEKTVIDLFEEQVTKTPSKTALFFEENELTYKELNERSNQLAHYLQSKYLIGSDNLIGVMLERSEQMLIAILGILKCRGAYVPIDPNYPEQRINYILEDTNCKVVIDSEELNKFNKDRKKYSKENREEKTESHDLTYVIYTSGSTGFPKGVMVEHKDLLNRITAEFTLLNIKGELRSCLTTNYVFDVSLLEIFLPLSFGGSVVIPSPEVLISPEDLVHLLGDRKVKLLQGAPSFISNLISKVDTEKMGVVNIHLQQLCIGGESLDNSLVQELKKKLPAVKINNHYGPTETVIDAIIFEDINGVEKNIIGRPISNARIYILNSENNLIPLNSIGELCVGGGGLARGYLNNIELTKEKFVENPFVKGERIYKTGDLARWQSDGTIEFIGRKDDQVKIRGYRIELGEVESVLEQNELIKDAVVLSTEDVNGEKILVAYLISEEELKLNKVREDLSQLLPDYMIPSAFVQIEELPLTSNGKIDKDALPNAEGLEISTGVEYIAPTNAIEKQLVKIWKAILGRKKIGVNDIFFELGGHSINVVRLSSQIHKDLEVKLTLKDIFDNATITKQAKLIEESKKVIFVDIESVEEQLSYKLSSAQTRLWLLSQFEEGNLAYNMPGVFNFEGDLDRLAFERSFKYLIERHEILRTTFRENKEGDIRQYISPSKHFPFSIALIDLIKEKKQDEKVKDILQKDIKTPFDLENGPLLSGKLLQTGNKKYIFIFQMHHIISDGWSMGLLIKELFELYTSYSKGADSQLIPLNIQYKDYSAWQIAQLEGDNLGKHKEYWLNQFSGDLPSLDLPSDKIRPAVRTYSGDVINAKIGKELTAKLRTIIQKEGCTLFMGLLGLVNSLLYKYTGEEDIVIGSPILGREHVDLQNQIGLYVNMLALRTTFQGNDSFNKLLANIKNVTINGFEHQAYPFDELVGTLDIPRDMSKNALFDVMVVLQDKEMGGDITEQMLGDIKVTEYKGRKHSISKFDLSFDFIEVGEDLNFSIEYNTDLFNKETIEQLGNHFQQLFAVLVESPEKSIKGLTYLSKKEENQILHIFNDTNVDFSREKTLVDLFEQQVVETPYSTALVCQGTELTYQELNEQSNQLANYLRSIYFIQPDELAGIKLERSEEMIVAILAVLKSGGAYVPIDPSYPDERIDYMLEDSKCTVLIDNSELLKFKNEQEKYCKKNLNKVNTETDLAYVIYTSGSTGDPKGVMIEHRSVNSFLNWSKQEFETLEFETMFGVTSICFDLSVFEIFYTLTSGKQLRVLKDGLDISNYLNTSEKILINTVPSVMKSLFNDNVNLKNVVGVNLAGEPIPKWIISKLEQQSIPTRNLYGPSEDTTYSTVCLISKENSTSIGKPISNTNIYILNEQNGLMPIGVNGEICISGDGLARGYLGKSELTAEKFVLNPFKDGSRIYKTGDIGRWLPDGTIQFIGRKDTQVKVRGYRIELGEIEKSLRDYKLLKEAIVLVKEDKDREKQLVAYIVSEDELNSNQLRKELGKSLPDYMIPQYFVQIDKLPLTLNGKLDSKYLLSLDISGMNSGVEYVAPRNDMENKMAELWSLVLQIEKEKIGVRDNFFGLGGHSLKATKLSSLVFKELEFKLSLKDIFTRPILEDQVHLLHSVDKTTYREIEVLPEQTNYDLSSAQRRLWILSRFKGGSEAYNIPIQLTLDGEYDLELFNQAFNATIRRHEILRTVFKEDENGDLKQWVLPYEEFGFSVDYRDYRDEGDKEEQAQTYISNDSYRPFDLVKGPLLRAALLQLKDDYSIFYFNMNHIISDGWSMNVLYRDVLAYYDGFKTGISPDISSLRIQYKDYSAWQLKQLAENSYELHRNYWVSRLSGELPIISLPSELDRPLIKTNSGNKLGTYLSREDSALLKEYCQQNGGSLFMGLLASLNILLHKYTGLEDILVGSPVAGRDHIDLEQQIGFFVNTLALRNEVKGEQSFDELFITIKQNTLDAYNHQMYPFDRLVEELELKRDTGRSAVFDVLVTLQNVSDQNEKIHEDVEAIIDYGLQSCKFDIEFSFQENGDYLSFEVDYNTDVYERKMIEQFIVHYKKILSELLNNPSQIINKIDYLTTYEKGLFLNDFNNTEVKYEDITVMELFEKQVLKTPDAVALVFEKENLTYSELNDRSNQLSDYLRHKQNITKGDNVGVMLERSLESVITMMGVMKSGACYVPIDHNYPSERINYILEDADINLLLTQTELLTIDLVEIEKVRDLKKIDLSICNRENLKPKNKLEDGSFVIYTSGSTGNPKGVVQTHCMLANLIQWNTHHSGIKSGLKHLQYTSFCFDVSLQDCWYTLSSGGTLYVISEEKRSNFSLLLNYIIEEELEVLSFPFSVLNNLFVDDKYEYLKNHEIKHIISSGEQLLVNETLHKFLEENPKLILHNHYGPSETHVVTSHSMGIYRDNIVSRSSIGIPVSNTQIYILDKGYNHVPLGVKGELYVAGKHLAKGYLNQPELTDEKFLPHPFKEGERIYKTGDLACWLSDGTISYFGRNDEQVKVRGYRIELGEIENALQTIDAVEIASVVVKEDSKGIKSLVAYIISKVELNSMAIRKALGNQLPDYMIPSYFVQLDELPLTTNGKIDKKSLPSPEGLNMNTGIEFIGPRDQLEEVLVKIWEEILGREKIGVLDNFFEIGGHSLKMNSMLNRVKVDCEVEITFELFLNDPTIESIALHIENLKSVQNDSSLVERKKIII